MNIIQKINKTIQNIDLSHLKSQSQINETLTFKGRTYTVSITPELKTADFDVSVKRQDCSRHQAFTDFFRRLTTCGEKAFGSRASQLQQGILESIQKMRSEYRIDRAFDPKFAENFSSFINIGSSQLKNLTEYEQAIITSPEFQKNFITLNNKLEEGKHPLLPQFKQYDTQYLGSDVGRFGDIRANKTTALDPQLNANAIKLGNDFTVHAGSFPKKEAPALAAHLKMLMGDAQNKKEATSCLVVLNSEADIAKHNLKPYFKESMNFPDQHIKTVVTPKKTLAGGIEHYQLAITDTKTNKTVNIPVIRVTDWADHSPRNTAQLQEISRLIQEHQGSAGVPFVHCNAGVGRTGQLIATDYMTRTANSRENRESLENLESLESLITSMRGQRNQLMVQTKEQLLMLALLAEQQGRPLITPVPAEKPKPTSVTQAQSSNMVIPRKSEYAIALQKKIASEATTKH
ncbi:protein-tyrosine phosphatase family protein [Yersinia mollaretii]|uniref:protein-tyrosine phosphatase family protein n=1 Tax=Yersinia mollaretii TaxID=33060 RepID=UPI0011A0212E|nr:protein-tyrosine phosphatase family protein [Yersinia mollaretii]